MVMVENKKGKGGRMEPEQKELHLQAMYLGHKIHEVRSYRQFLKIVEE